jgi:hypothetical protein
VVGHSEDRSSGRFLIIDGFARRKHPEVHKRKWDKTKNKISKPKRVSCCNQRLKKKKKKTKRNSALQMEEPIDDVGEDLKSINDFIASSSVDHIMIFQEDRRKRKLIHQFCDERNLVSRTKYRGAIAARRCPLCTRWNEPPTYVAESIDKTPQMDRIFRCVWCGECSRYSNDSDDEDCQSGNDSHDKRVALTDEEDARMAFEMGEIKLKWEATGSMLIMRREECISYKKAKCSWNESFNKHSYKRYLCLNGLSKING